MKELTRIGEYRMRGMSRQDHERALYLQCCLSPGPILLYILLRNSEIVIVLIVTWVFAIEDQPMHNALASNQTSWHG